MSAVKSDLSPNFDALRSQILASIGHRLDLRDEELYAEIEEKLTRLGEASYLPLSERLRLREQLFNSFRRLDVLQELLDKSDINEIMVNGPQDIFIEHGGRLERWEKVFESSEKLEDIIQQIVSRINRSVNTANPIADARLPDGSRVHIVLPPIALNGPVLTIRKFPEPISMERLIQFGTLSREASAYLKPLIVSGYNIFISGGTSSGKSTFLNALSEFIPSQERVITIEDSAELQIQHIPNLVRLETRNATALGDGEINMSMLIKACLRMRPDRIIVGEVRDKAALDMLTAMNTGHDGSLSTGHANSAEDMLRRLETMVLSAAELPLPAVRSQIASAIDLIIHLGRLPDKSRRVLEITEIGGYEHGEIQLNPLFRYRAERACLEKVGSLIHCDKLRLRGEALPDAAF